MKKQIYIFLTLRLLKRQRLRTAAIFCGMLFSVYLLCAFAGFGYEFWRQVHSGIDADSEFDATEGILILLVTVLFLLVALCAAVLLANLFSLTSSQRWKSLSRLLSLGADAQGLFVMMFLDVLLLFGVAVPVGFVLAWLTVTSVGVPYGVPPRMNGVVLLALFWISCMCARKPLMKHSILHPNEVRMRKRRRLRVAVTLFAAILLYVPADYVIGTNLAVHRSELHMKYGISYSASPKNWRELAEAVDECGRLAEAMGERGQSAEAMDKRGQSGEVMDKRRQSAEAMGERGQSGEVMDKRGQPSEMIGERRQLTETMDKCGQPVACNVGGDTLLYVLLSVSAEVKTNAMSRELCGVLKKAGWVEQPVFSAEGTICFLEDKAYEAYVRTCGGGADVASVLVNRYVNRGTWKEQAKPSFREAKVLERADDGDRDAVTFFYRFDDEFSPVSTSRMTPERVADVPPDGMDFGGSLTLVVPLSELEAVCLDGADVRRMQVCGEFEDSGENVFSLFFMSKLPATGHRESSDVFSVLEACLGEYSVGSLQNTREIFQEWYASMHGLHLAMQAISGLLFFMAVLNLFSMMIFQYMEQRRGLAIRWSLGESSRGLLKFLIGEHLRGFYGALVIGVMVSAVLCRVIYGIFQPVWRTDFVFPGRQIGAVIAMALLVSLAVVFVDGYFIRHQRFLEDIRRTEW